MQPLIDGDILAYECCFAAEASWRYEGQEGIPPFDRVAAILEARIETICLRVEATQPPILFLTGKKNFRNDIAKRQKYKDRASNKPFHYLNVYAYIRGKYDYRLTEGLEADDLMAIEQTARPQETIICSRDKDLRQVEGWHYGWELENQPEFGPEATDYLGKIQLSANRKKIKGVGVLFFYSQTLTGDTIDSIPGLPGCGPVKAMEILREAKTEEEAFTRVYEAYQVVFGERADEELLEQGRLLWLTRELNENSSPRLWEFPVDVSRKEQKPISLESPIETVPTTIEPMKQSLGRMDG